MKKNSDSVEQLVDAQKAVLNTFQCEGDFFVKPLLGLRWEMRQVDGFYFLTYWTAEDKKIEAVIVKKNNKPMIYKAEPYTMVVAIDCVKIGFLFDSNKIWSD